MDHASTMSKVNAMQETFCSPEHSVWSKYLIESRASTKHS